MEGEPGPSSETAIELIDVRKVHVQGRREVVALDGVSLTIPCGGFTTFMGPSGSGKSTLLHLAGGLDQPTSGEVRILGEATGGMGDDRLTLLRRDRVGFVFQFFNLLPTLNIVENAALPALIGGRNRAASLARASELLSGFGLADRLAHHPDELSGGEVQRVAIARALINDPPIVLADEPTGNLDSATGTGILELLARLATERTVVIVTHDPRAAEFGDRLIRIRDGRLE